MRSEAAESIHVGAGPEGEARAEIGADGRRTNPKLERGEVTMRARGGVEDLLGATVGQPQASSTRVDRLHLDGMDHEIAPFRAQHTGSPHTQWSVETGAGRRRQARPRGALHLSSARPRAIACEERLTTSHGLRPPCNTLPCAPTSRSPTLKKTLGLASRPPDAAINDSPVAAQMYYSPHALTLTMPRDVVSRWIPDQPQGCDLALGPIDHLGAQRLDLQRSPSSRENGDLKSKAPAAMVSGSNAFGVSMQYRTAYHLPFPPYATPEGS